MIRRSLLRSVPVAFGAAVLAACGAEPIMACTDELRFEIAPADTTVAVGASFTPRTRFSTCGGRQTITTLTATLSSRSPTVVQVDATGKVLTAVGVGTAVLDVARSEGAPLGTIQVTVVAAP